eukprot:TRINITY_DN10072_c0_g1_i2.p1 TRINITY_DN10072_c0_g1~~TRINITY_DN10072_c0_g1_i2.p1  ORF type:complete len:707 (-),score=146.46 TRINITY_DN10072_c0_g1_i2:138-2258(-)
MVFEAAPQQPPHPETAWLSFATRGLRFPPEVLRRLLGYLRTAVSPPSGASSAVTSGDWARKTRAPARPQSAPSLNASYDTEFAYVPNLSQERLDALVVDKSRQRSHPPQLREHLQLTKWLKADDYKRCISYIIECLKQASEKSQNLSGETPEEASTRMAAAEVERVGPIEDANVRKVLLLWTLGVSLEACGEVRMAALLFSTCMQLDPSNPVHCYHRGVCLLRAGRNSSAYEDFHQAVSLCIERERRPPLIYLSCRALAGAVLPKMMPEVWADFEMVRQLSQNPDLPHRLVAQNVHDWEDYKNMVSIPVPQEGPHRHWVAVLIARCHGKHGETVSDTELRSFVRFIRGLHGLSSMTLEVAKKGLTQFSTRSVVEGQAFLLENGWYCVLSGTLDVMRFGRQTPPGELYKKLAAQGRPLVPPSGSEPANVGELAVSDPLGMPCSMEEVPELQVVDTLPEQSTFCSGDTFGPLQDGWLVAGEGGVEVLCLKLDQYKSFVRRCGGMQAQVEADVGLLKRCTLFRSCPTHVLLTMVSEIFAKREALCGEDPINAWPGLVVIRSGRLQLWADSSWGGGNPGSPHSPRGPEELCVLGPGDILGLDTVIGGPPELQVLHSKVLSHKLQAWVLPPERKEDAEDIGLQGYLREFRETHRRELLERANAANSWARHRPQALALARKHQRTIDYVRGEVDPPPRPAGGVVHSWRPRQF